MTPLKDPKGRAQAIVSGVSPWLMSLGALIVANASLRWHAVSLWLVVGVVITLVSGVMDYRFGKQEQKRVRGVVVGLVFLLAWEAWVWVGVGLNHATFAPPSGP